VVGRSGSGKTTLIERLLPLLRARGLRVSTIKHTHHDLDIDTPGKDSFRHRQAGAEEVMMVAGRRWALMRETPAPQNLSELAARLAPVDLVLVEGFRGYGFPKIEVHRPELGKAPLWPQTEGVAAVAAPCPIDGCPYPWLDINAPAAIAAWITSTQRGAWGPAACP
jgi:molybdopterin-guanine dinucleotide biosynthesis protein B